MRSIQTKNVRRGTISRDNVSAVLRRLRKESGMTQIQLAAKMKVTRTCISNWESAVRLPDCNSVIRLAGIFHVPVDYIYGVTDRRYNIKIPDCFELDLTKLNSAGRDMLQEYYKLLLQSEKYRNE